MQCRLRHEPTCSHTAGVLTPGRWYIGVDAPAAFTLQATLVRATALRPHDAPLRRTVFGLSAVGGSSTGWSSEGTATSEYFFFDPAPHERLRLQVSLESAAAAGGGLDVYIRSTLTLACCPLPSTLTQPPRPTSQPPSPSTPTLMTLTPTRRRLA